MNSPFRLLLSTLSILMLAVITGCASKSVPSGMVRVAVLDGAMTDENRETRKTESGWWFGAKTRYDSGTAGILLGDVLSEEFSSMPGVEVLPRTDYRSYMAQKERLLADIYPDLTSGERLLILETQDPLDFGRSLNVDYVIASRVNKARLVHNHTFHTWSGIADFTLRIYDVEGGSLVWEWQGKDTDWFSSQSGVMEQLAEKARKAATKSDPFGIYPE